MPNKPATTNRALRIDDETWEELGAAAEAAGTDRTAVLRQLAHWWLRRPGAKLPDRPERRTARGNEGAIPGPTTTNNNQR